MANEKAVPLGEIKDWKEWLALWERNEKGNFSPDNSKRILSITLNLLHSIPSEEWKRGGEEDRNRERSEKIRFVVGIIKQYGHYGTRGDEVERKIGLHAYQTLTKNLLPRWFPTRKEEFERITWRPGRVKREKSVISEEIKALREVMDFLGGNVWPITDKEPYQSLARKFIINVSYSRYGGDYYVGEEIEKVLAGQGMIFAVIDALINIGAFSELLHQATFHKRNPDFIVAGLKEKLAVACWDHNSDWRKYDLTKEFPEGRDGWKAALEDSSSKAFKHALICEEDMAVCLLKVLIYQQMPFLQNSVYWRMNEKELEEARKEFSEEMRL